jgi:hypothetical protein
MKMKGREWLNLNPTHSISPENADEKRETNNEILSRKKAPLARGFVVMQQGCG